MRHSGSSGYGAAPTRACIGPGASLLHHLIRGDPETIVGERAHAGRNQLAVVGQIVAVQSLGDRGGPEHPDPEIVFDRRGFAASPLQHRHRIDGRLGVGHGQQRRVPALERGQQAGRGRFLLRLAGNPQVDLRVDPGRHQRQTTTVEAGHRGHRGAFRRGRVLDAHQMSVLDDETTIPLDPRGGPEVHAVDEVRREIAPVQLLIRTHFLRCFFISLRFLDRRRA
jgi:hypothetical protein